MDANHGLEPEDFGAIYFNARKDAGTNTDWGKSLEDTPGSDTPSWWLKQGAYDVSTTWGDNWNSEDDSHGVMR
jgi:hypothetical protein